MEYMLLRMGLPKRYVVGSLRSIECVLEKISILKVDDFVKSLNQTAKKKDPDARRANPEE